MANELNKFNIGNTSFNIVDNKAREFIENLESNKSDKFEALYPLGFNDDGNLTINLKDYYTKEAIDNKLEQQSNELELNQNTVQEKINNICIILQKILGENNIKNNDDGIVYSEELPSLINTTEEINSLKTNIQVLGNNLNDKIEVSESMLNNKIENSESMLNSELNAQSEDINSLSNRCTELENEIFNPKEVDPSKSKIQDMYEKVEEMYAVLKNIGIINS
jgi:hypothetical protein